MQLQLLVQFQDILQIQEVYNMSPLFEIPCVILSGGKSSRMGEDKSFLPFGNSNSLIQYQFDRLSPYFKDIYISSKTDKFPFFKNKSLILDKNEIYSPIVALESIFSNIQNDKVFIITVDNPLVTINSISKLIDKSINFDIVVAETLKIHNLCGVFSKSTLGIVKKMLSEDIHKVFYLLKNVNTYYFKFENDDEFINLNHKEDYEKALELTTYSN